MSLFCVGQLFLGMGPALECSYYIWWHSIYKNWLSLSQKVQIEDISQKILINFSSTQVEINFKKRNKYISWDYFPYTN